MKSRKGRKGRMRGGTENAGSSPTNSNVVTSAAKGIFGFVIGSWAVGILMFLIFAGIFGYIVYHFMNKTPSITDPGNTDPDA